MSKIYLERYGIGKGVDTEKTEINKGVIHAELNDGSRVRFHFDVHDRLTISSPDGQLNLHPEVSNSVKITVSKL